MKKSPSMARPPDGGWGWVVAGSAFVVNGLSYGLLRSLGLALPVFAEYFDRNTQDTAWVSAIALAVQQAASPVGSALSTRWGARPVVMLGGIITSLGFILSAFASSLLHLYLGLGLLAGLGNILQATGLVMMLMSLGGLLGPPLSGFLRDETGDFKASFLVCGSFILSGSFIYLILPGALPPCHSAPRPPTLPPEQGELLPSPESALASPRDPHFIPNTTC